MRHHLKLAAALALVCGGATADPMPLSTVSGPLEAVPAEMWQSVAPVEVALVRKVNGRIVEMGPWVPAGRLGVDRAADECVFDGIQLDPANPQTGLPVGGAACGLASGQRYAFPSTSRVVATLRDFKLKPITAGSTRLLTRIRGYFRIAQPEPSFVVLVTFYDTPGPLSVCQDITGTPAISGQGVAMRFSNLGAGFYNFQQRDLNLLFGGAGLPLPADGNGSFEVEYLSSLNGPTNFAYSPVASPGAWGTGNLGRPAGGDSNRPFAQFGGQTDRFRQDRAPADNVGANYSPANESAGCVVADNAQPCFRAGWSWAMSFFANVADPPPPGPGAFSLVSPVGGTLTGPSPVFEWTQSSNTTFYNIVIVPDVPNRGEACSSGSTVLGYVEGERMQLLTNLCPGVCYRWSVQAVANAPSNAPLSGDRTASSDAGLFCVAFPPSAPCLLSPPFDASGVPLQPRLRWDPFCDLLRSGSGRAPQNFNVRLWAASDPNTLIINVSGITDVFFDVPSPLSPNTQYFWDVAAVAVGGTVNSLNGPYRFTTGANTPPGEFKLVSPINDEIVAKVPPNTSGNVDLTWTTATGAVNYKIQVASDPGFSSIVFDSGNVTGTTLTVSPALAGGARYFWRASATNPGGTVQATPTFGQFRIKCVADIDSNGSVGANDLTLLLLAFGASSADPNWNPACDLDGNGTIGGNDLTLLLTGFGCAVPPSSSR
ncbi:MAG: hypothetical protein IBJ11_00105 [Phycisphaerales bacterium]|nr:hypothetical protein [Phycisphaerales bacterium]